MHELESSLSAPGPNLSGLKAMEERFYDAGKAPATVRAFNSDLASFPAFATQNNLPYLPSTVETVVLYVSSLAAADPPCAMRPSGGGSLQFPSPIASAVSIHRPRPPSFRAARDLGRDPSDAGHRSNPRRPDPAHRGRLSR